MVQWGYSSIALPMAPRVKGSNPGRLKASFWGLFKTNFYGYFRKLFLFTKFNFLNFGKKFFLTMLRSMRLEFYASNYLPKLSGMAYFKTSKH